MPASHNSVFTGQIPFLQPNQQHQSTEGKVSGEIKQFSIAHLLINKCTKIYWNTTTTAEVIDGGWVVYFFGSTKAKM